MFPGWHVADHRCVTALLPQADSFAFDYDAAMQYLRGIAQAQQERDHSPDLWQSKSICGEVKDIHQVRPHGGVN